MLLIKVKDCIRLWFNVLSGSQVRVRAHNLLLALILLNLEEVLRESLSVQLAVHAQSSAALGATKLAGVHAHVQLVKTWALLSVVWSILVSVDEVQVLRAAQTGVGVPVINAVVEEVWTEGSRADGVLWLRLVDVLGTVELWRDLDFIQDLVFTLLLLQLLVGSSLELAALAQS